MVLGFCVLFYFMLFLLSLGIFFQYYCCNNAVYIMDKMSGISKGKSSKVILSI